MGWPLSHHIQQWNKLHFQTPQSFPQPTMIWNWDLTSSLILWIGHESKAFKNYKTGLINFTTSCCIFIFKRWNSTSNLSSVFIPINKGICFSFHRNNYIITIPKTSNSNEWPFDYFNTHAITTKFKYSMTISTIVGLGPSWLFFVE
jgi:hypothetical protein